MTLALKPKRGGFLRPFGCGEFIRDFLLGLKPHGSIWANPEIGAPQSTIFRQYKLALMRAKATDIATQAEEKTSRKEKRFINQKKIAQLAQEYFEGIPYKTTACRYNSFKTYFSDLKRLGWVEFTHQEKHSLFQNYYPDGQPQKYFRLTKAGIEAGVKAWKNPHKTLYGQSHSKSE